MTQKEKILQHLTDFGSITDNDARKLHINRLAARINDLRKDGHAIETEIESYRNEDKRMVRYAVYRLKK